MNEDLFRDLFHRHLRQHGPAALTTKSAWRCWRNEVAGCERWPDPSAWTERQRAIYEQATWMLRGGQGRSAREVHATGLMLLAIVLATALTIAIILSLECIS